MKDYQSSAAVKYKIIILGIRANTLACQKPCIVRLALTLLSVCYPLFSVPPAADKSQIEPTRALANRRKPRGSGISHGSRFARPSGRTWSNLRPLECVNFSARKLDLMVYVTKKLALYLTGADLGNVGVKNC